jgi:phospholipid/cholesterol/gamma-HCH transport system substrate-binding protein
MGDSMDTNVNYAIAGVFVITLIIFIVLGIIWLSAGLSTESVAIYKIYMNESVSGLSPDAPVEFNGVKVGKIKKIKINHDNPELVVILIAVKKRTPVTQGTRAKLSLQVVTGVAHIELIDKGNSKLPLRLKTGENYPIIPAEPSLLVRLDAMLAEFRDIFKQLGHSVNSLLSDKNLRYIGKLLEHGDHSFQKLQTETIPNANHAISNFNDLTQDLTEFTDELKENPSILIRGKTGNIRKGPGE